MDKFWDRNPSKLVVIGRCDADEKTNGHAERGGDEKTNGHAEPTKVER